MSPCHFSIGSAGQAVAVVVVVAAVCMKSLRPACVLGNHGLHGTEHSAHREKGKDTPLGVD